MRNFKKRLHRVFAALGIVILIFVILELFSPVLTGVDISSNPDILMLPELDYDATLGWKCAPGYRGRSKPVFKLIAPVNIRVNSHGFRDGDWNEKIRRAKEFGLEKILFLGDSLLYGLHIDTENRITEQLEELYVCNGKSVVTFNAGIPFFSTDQELRALETLCPHIEPDAVILYFNFDDLAEASLPYYPQTGHGRVYKPFYDVSGDLVENNMVPKRFSVLVRNTLLKHFEIRYLVDKCGYLFEDILRWYTDADPAPLPLRLAKPLATKWGALHNELGLEWAILDHHFSEFYTRNIGRTYALIKKMDNICKQRGARFIVLVDLSMTNIYDIDVINHPNLFNFRAFLGDNNIEHIDLSEVNADGFSYYNYVDGDGHPNFLSNYASSVLVARKLDGDKLDLSFECAKWYKNLPTAVDFSRDDLNNFLFGHWMPTEEIDTGMGFRVMADFSQFILKSPPCSQHIQITVEGSSFLTSNSITFLDRSRNILGKVNVSGPGDFRTSVTIDANQVEDTGLLCIGLQSEKTALPQLWGPYEGDTKVSFLIRKIEASCVQGPDQG